MSTVRTRVAENIEELFVFLVLGLGFVALFAELDFFWLIWVLGFAVFLPLIDTLTGEHEAETGGAGSEPEINQSAEPHNADDGSTRDALATLRDRYARGDLTDEQFERKLDALLETQTPEAATEWRTRERNAESSHGPATEPSRERERT